MPDSANKQTSKIIGRGLLAAESIAAELRARLVTRLSKEHRVYGSHAMLELARNTLREFEPLLADTLADTEIAGWLGGVVDVTSKLAPDTLAQLAFVQGGAFSGRPPVIGAPPPAMPSGDARFPVIEKAAKSLMERNVVTRAQFDALTAEAREQAFTVARTNSVETITAIRDTLAKTIEQGPSLKVFKEQLADVLETSHIGPGHLENIYRTNVQAAFTRGFDTIADNEIVRSIFEYATYDAIDDARVRPEHLALMKLGIDSSNIFRSADPFWQVFSIPWEWNCRCSKTLITIEAAARYGLKEAQLWLDTGEVPPLVSRLDFINFRPDPKFRPSILQAA